MGYWKSRNRSLRARLTEGSRRSSTSRKAGEMFPWEPSKLSEPLWSELGSNSSMKTGAGKASGFESRAVQSENSLAAFSSSVRRSRRLRPPGAGRSGGFCGRFRPRVCDQRANCVSHVISLGHGLPPWLGLGRWEVGCLPSACIVRKPGCMYCQYKIYIDDQQASPSWPPVETRSRSPVSDACL